MTRGWRLVFFLSLCFYIVEAQTNSSLFTQHKFHRLNEEQGLTNNIVHDIIQDTLGQIWVATEGGVSRYQGYKFQTYLKDRNNPNSLPHNFVNRLFVDDRNQIWAMTEFGVAKYDYQTDDIVRFKPNQIVNSISSMGIDDKGDYYFGNVNGGIWKGKDEMILMDLFDPITGVDFSKKGVSELLIFDNVLWIALSEEGIVRYDLGAKTIDYISSQELIGEDHLEVFDISVDSYKGVWFATDAGVLRVNNNRNRTIIITDILPDDLPSDDYLSISEDKNQNIWIGTRQNGMFSFKNHPKGDVSNLHHFKPEVDDRGVSHRTVSKIFQDNSGLIWLGTHNGGINVFNPEGEKVRFITHKVNNSNSLNYKSVWGINPSSDGKIWIGTDGNGLNILNPDDGRIENAPWTQLEGKAVLCVMEDRYSRLWIGTYEHGVYLIDLKTDMVRNFTKESKYSDLIVNDIRAFYQTDSGRILIGTNVGGLYSFDEKEHKVSIMKGSEGLDVRVIEMTGDDQLYLGTFRNGLVSCNLTNAPTKYENLNENNGNSNLVISDILSVGNCLWLATRDNGLVAFDTKSKAIKYSSDNEMLRNASISGISSDLKGNLWLTTNSGIYVYEKGRNTVKSFDSKDGIQLGHFNYGSIFFSEEGYLVAGGINGVNLFYPDQLLTETHTEPVILNELTVLNRKVTPANSEIYPTGKSIFLTNRIDLNYSDNLFILNFSIPGFNISKQNKFIYMLEGYDNDWQKASEVNEATYRNVPPGKYTFRVKNLYYEDTFKELKVWIAPPYWRTWQAYLLLIVMLVLALWKFNSFNSSRIALQQQVKFEQELREKDHQSMQEKLRFYTNFSHELKTPLTLIQGPVNDLIKTEHNPEHLQYLQLIKKNTSVLLKFIGRMLEFRKIEMNKMVFNVGHYDLNILAQEEAESFGYLAKEKDILFGFYSENNLYTWVDIEKIQIVLNNLLSNAIKFSKEGMKVKFGVLHEDTNVVIEVQNQGVGIKEDEIENIFSPFYQASNSVGSGGTGIGLALCKNFVELHGGTIEVSSNTSEGTKFLVKLPKDKKHLEGKEYVRFVDVNNEEIEANPTRGYVEIDGKTEALGDTDKLILIVDDNRDISTYVSTLFSSNFKIILADNGKDAFEKAVTSIPDIIISDMMMPGMDGLELCKKLKENMATSHIPIILLTAKNSNQSKIKGFEVGADDYITKPFSSDLLKVRVNNILNRRKLLKLKYSAGDLLDENSQQSPKEVEFVLQVEATILSMIDASEFNVTDLCKELGMSQTSLYRKIKSLTNDSIQLFIRKIKIKKAAILLKNEDMTVTEVAFALNFSDLKYFRKCFKEQFEMTPSEYKNKKSAIIDQENIQSVLGI